MRAKFLFLHNILDTLELAGWREIANKHDLHIYFT